MLAACAHSSIGLAANGVELLAVVAGGSTAFTVSFAAIFRCINTGLPASFQPLPLPLFWYHSRARKPRPPADTCELHPPLMGDTDLGLGLGPGDGPLTAFACNVGLPGCPGDSNVTELPQP